MKAEKPTQEDIDRLKAWIEANNYTVYTVLRHVSASGAYREISVVIPVMRDNIAVGDGIVASRRDMSTVQQFVHPSYTIAGLLGMKYTEKRGHNAVVCTGGGMDMGWNLVYNLSSKLYGDGYKIRQEWI